MTTPNAELIATMVARWSHPASRPLFKGALIDDYGCCCAQGDVLRVCGWDDYTLRNVDQDEADASVAEALGISRFHAILLRTVNDREDDCPQSVLDDPERILGPHAARVLAFGRHLDRMTGAEWAAAWDAVRAAAGDAAWYAAADDAGNAAADAAGDAAADDAGNATRAAGNATGAVWEIMGAPELRERGQPFHFLPIFGFANPEAIPL